MISVGLRKISANVALIFSLVAPGNEYILCCFPRTGRKIFTNTNISHNFCKTIALVMAPHTIVSVDWNHPLVSVQNGNH